MYSRAYSVGASIGVFVYILIFLGVGIIFGIASKHINESKGYSGGFAWGFFLGLIGIIVVACKPNINKQSSYSESSGSDSDYYHRPSQPAYNTWKCVCGQDNSENLNYCTRCRRTRNEAMIELSQNEKKECPHCGARNRKTNQTCFACGRPMYETDNLYAGETQEETKTESTRTMEPDSYDGPNADMVSLLKQLAALHDQGILTDQEFEAKKADILAKI